MSISHASIDSITLPSQVLKVCKRHEHGTYPRNLSSQERSVLDEHFKLGVFYPNE